MSTPANQPASSPSACPSSAATAFGAILVRLVVPLWVLAGALFKLYERDPKNLPSVIIASAKDFNLDLDILLRTLIGCELFAAGVMLLVPRFARLMATFMLVCFCAILLGEMYRQATSCGCFGSIKLKPWQMLLIDGTLLALVLAFAYRWRTSAPPRVTGNPLAAAGAAAVIAAISITIAFAVPKRAGIERVINDVPAAASGANSSPTSSETIASNGATAVVNAPPSTAPVKPTVKTLPNSWYADNLEQWVGKPWREIDLFQLMDAPPRDMDAAKRYIVFYGRTCEHCLAMLEELTQPLDGQLTLVEVPASRTVMTDAGAWPMPLTVEPILQPEMLTLPLGPSWLIQTPLVVRVENGTVVCAQEGDHKKCMGME